MTHNFYVEVFVSDDDNPVLNALLDYAEVGARMRVECELHHGYAGSYIQPPEPSEANFSDAELDEINFYPHNGEDSLKIEFLMTSEMRDEIVRIARAKIEKNWNSDYEEKAWDSYADEMMESDRD